MKILTLFPSNEWMTWNMSHGIAPTLIRMGHQANPWHIPDTDFRPIHTNFARQLAELQDLSTYYDLAIITAAEKLAPATWQFLKCPKALWFADSTGRADSDFTPRYKLCQTLTPHLFFCGAQDAYAFNAHWLPPAADITIFKPDTAAPKKHQIAFVGHLYGLRVKLAADIRAMHIPLECPETARTPWHPTEEHAAAHARELAALYNSCAVIIHLPSITHCAHSAHFEIAACQIPLIITARTGRATLNDTAFIPPLPSFDPLHPETLKPLLDDPISLIESAQLAYAHTIRHHTLELALSRLIQTVFPQLPLPLTPPQA
jgi:hypothetical protein